MLLALLTGCAGLHLADELDGLPPARQLDEVPFFPQTEFHCGPAALAAMLAHSGRPVDYSDLVDRVYLPGRKGSLQAEIVAAARSHERVVYRLPPRVDAVLAEVAAGRPVLILENQGLESRPIWHYAVVIGYDRARNRMILHTGRHRARPVPAARWLRRWERAGRWAVVVLPPGQLPATPRRKPWLQAAADFEAMADARAAHRVWHATIDIWPDEPIAWLGLGNSAFGMGDHDAAIAAYQALLRLEPDHAAGRLNLAIALDEAGSPCEAARLFTAVSDHPQLGDRARRRGAAARGRCGP